MDRRSWLWRRKSSDKSPGETESSGSMSSLSERFSDEQGYPANRSQSLEVTSKAADPDEEADESVKTLSERLSAALLNISAKEELVKQHAKVAEEAVSGWEKAENEVSALKKQLEAASQKNASLENRVGYLDGALKECVRQLRQAREEQEEKISEVIAKKTLEWESIKADLEKENAALRSELLSRVEELEMMTIERDLSTGAAESASKQHLESIKRVSKLEAECLRLKAVTRKALTANNDLKSFSTSSVCIESFTDSQSDAGERNEWARSPLVMEFDNFKKDKALGKSLAVSSPEIGLMDDFLEMERLAAQPNQSIGLENENLLKSELEAMINRTAELEEELEKKEAEKAELIVALTKCRQQLDASQTQQKEAEEKLKVANASMMKRTSKLEKEIEEKEAEKAELVVALGQCKQQLDTSLKQLKEAEEKLKSANARMIKRTAKLEEEIEKKEAEKAELVLDLSQHRKQLDTSLTRIKEAEEKLKAANASIEATESQMREMDLEMKVLVDKVKLLEENIEREHVLLDERSEKCRTLEDEILKMKKETEHQHVAISGKELKLKQDQELAVAASRFADCQKTIASLGQKLKSLASLEDFLAESVEMSVVMDEGLEYPQNGKAEHKLETGGFYVQRNSDYSKPSRDFANLGKNTTEKIQHGLVRFPSRGKDRHLN